MVFPSRKRPASVVASPQKKRSASRLPQERKNTNCDDAVRDRAIVSRLCAWFDTARRDLPFRQGKNAYATWVSEIMLQQTQVKTVIPYFERWMQRFPSVEALADATEADVLSAWQGLGYYSRARNLHRAAKLVVANHAGRLPRESTALLELPGIGRYTAGAISSIAYDQPEPAVDGNVIRVLCRLDALRGDPRQRPLAEALWERAAKLVQVSDPSRFNQALMELGALLCTPNKPACALCPLVGHCRGQALGLTEQLPELLKAKKPEKRHVIVLFSERRGAVLLRHQPETATHWTKLYVLPYFECVEKTVDARRNVTLSHLRQAAPRVHFTTSEPLTQLTYPITRFRFHAEIYAVRALTPLPEHSRYHSLEAAQQLAMPAPHRRLLKLLLSL
jgi:A/G-specific adenine glycosylase